QAEQARCGSGTPIPLPPLPRPTGPLLLAHTPQHAPSWLTTMGARFRSHWPKDDSVYGDLLGLVVAGPTWPARIAWARPAVFQPTDSVDTRGRLRLLRLLRILRLRLGGSEMSTTIEQVRPGAGDIKVAVEALTHVKGYLSRHQDRNDVRLVVHDEHGDETLTVPRGAVELLARILA